MLGRYYADNIRADLAKEQAKLERARLQQQMFLQAVQGIGGGIAQAGGAIGQGLGGLAQAYQATRPSPADKLRREMFERQKGLDDLRGRVRGSLGAESEQAAGLQAHRADEESAYAKHFGEPLPPNPMGTPQELAQRGTQAGILRDLPAGTTAGDAMGFLTEERKKLEEFQRGLRQQEQQRAGAAAALKRYGVAIPEGADPAAFGAGFGDVAGDLSIIERRDDLIKSAAQKRAKEMADSIVKHSKMLGENADVMFGNEAREILTQNANAAAVGDPGVIMELADVVDRYVKPEQRDAIVKMLGGDEEAKALADVAIENAFLKGFDERERALVKQAFEVRKADQVDDRLKEMTRANMAKERFQRESLGLRKRALDEAKNTPREGILKMKYVDAELAKPRQAAGAIDDFLLAAKEFDPSGKLDMKMSEFSSKYISNPKFSTFDAMRKVMVQTLGRAQDGGVLQQAEYDRWEKAFSSDTMTFKQMVEQARALKAAFARRQEAFLDVAEGHYGKGTMRQYRGLLIDPDAATLPYKKQSPGESFEGKSDDELRRRIEGKLGGM